MGPNEVMTRPDPDNEIKDGAIVAYANRADGADDFENKHGRRLGQHGDRKVPFVRLDGGMICEQIAAGAYEYIKRIAGVNGGLPFRYNIVNKMSISEPLRHPVINGRPRSFDVVFKDILNGHRSITAGGNIYRETAIKR